MRNEEGEAPGEGQMRDRLGGSGGQARRVCISVAGRASRPASREKEPPSSEDAWARERKAGGSVH